MVQEFHLLAGKLEQQCKDVEAGEDSKGGEKGGGSGGEAEGGGGAGGWRKLLEKTRREMLEAAGLALQVAFDFDSVDHNKAFEGAMSLMSGLSNSEIET